MSQRAQEKFRMSAKNVLIARRLTVAGLARKIGRSRTAVSLAINQGGFPGTRQLIASELGLPLK